MKNLPELPEAGNGVEIRHVPGHLGYAVTDTGDVYGCKNKGFGVGQYRLWKKIKPHLCHTGYFRIGLTKRKRVYVHCLVLAAFVRKKADGEETCHNNGIRTDNRACNLRWDTSKNNHADRKSHGTARFGETHPMATVANKDVLAIRMIWSRHQGDRKVISFLARWFNVKYRVVWQIVTRRTWRHLP